MNKDRPPDSPELVAEGTLFVSFVLEAIPLPPGTPAQPRADRPPYRPDPDVSAQPPEAGVEDKSEDDQQLE